MPIMWLDSGQAQTIDCLDPATRASQTPTYYGSWGSSATAPAVSQTNLLSENPEARVAATVSQPAANTLRWLWEVTATGNRVVNEFAVNTANTGATAIIRGTLSTLNIETGDRVEFTVDLALKDISE